jgi:hypothetical protein
MPVAQRMNSYPLKDIMTDWQNRIVAYRQIAANELLANPANARRHPPVQRNALRGSLDTMGWVAPVVVNAKTGFLIDGHARVEEVLTRNENALIPVIEVDITEDEEKLFLASFDWITTLANYDRDSLNSLLQDVHTDNENLQSMLAGMAEVHYITPHDTDLGAIPSLGSDNDEEHHIHCPNCGFKFNKP